MCDEIIEKKDIGGLDSSTNRNEINYGLRKIHPCTSKQQMY